MFLTLVFIRLYLISKYSKKKSFLKQVSNLKGEFKPTFLESITLYFEKSKIKLQLQLQVVQHKRTNYKFQAQADIIRSDRS